MLTGISITFKASDRRRPKVLTRDRNAPQKYVWRAEIVLLSADGVGTDEIIRKTGKSKTCVWRSQERFKRDVMTACCGIRCDPCASRRSGQASPSAPWRSPRSIRPP
jgi:hypothetical protein